MKNERKINSQVLSASTESNKKGFTLIELLVTFSILSVLASIGFLSFVTYSRKQIIQQSASDLKQAIDIARNNSLSVVKPAGCPANSELSSYIVSICVGGNPTCNVGGTIYTGNNYYETRANCQPTQVVSLQKKLPQNASFGGSSPCQNITFASVRPQTTGVPCAVNITLNGQTLTVSVDSQGYVSFPTN